MAPVSKLDEHTAGFMATCTSRIRKFEFYHKFLECRCHGSHPQHTARGQTLFKASNNQPIRGPDPRHVAGVSVSSVLNHIPRHLLHSNTTEAERRSRDTCGGTDYFLKVLYLGFGSYSFRIRGNVQQQSQGV